MRAALTPHMAWKSAALDGRSVFMVLTMKGKAAGTQGCQRGLFPGSLAHRAATGSSWLLPAVGNSAERRMKWEKGEALL